MKYVCNCRFQIFQIENLNFDVRGKTAALHKENSQKGEGQLLSIIPALPILPEEPPPPRLTKRSFSSLRYLGRSLCMSMTN